MDKLAITQGCVIDTRNQTPIDRYSKCIPDIMDDAIAGLSNRNGRAIVVLLDLKGRKTFSDVRKELNLKQGQSNKLAYWLNKLEENGLVMNEIIKVPGEKEKSYYGLSPFGKDFLEKILEAYRNYISPMLEAQREDITYVEKDLTSGEYIVSSRPSIFVGPASSDIEPIETDFEEVPQEISRKLPALKGFVDE